MFGFAFLMSSSIAAPITCQAPPAVIVPQRISNFSAAPAIFVDPITTATKSATVMEQDMILLIFYLLFYFSKISSHIWSSICPTSAENL
jgi:hypothetical protein